MRYYCPRCGRIVPGVHPYQVGAEHQGSVRRIGPGGDAVTGPCGGRFEWYNPRRKAQPVIEDSGKVKPRTEAKIC